LKEIKVFMEKKNKRIEDLDDERWISYLAFFFVEVTGHLNTLTKSYKAKISSALASRPSKLSFDCRKIN
jgi:hypothetical protein